MSISQTAADVRARPLQGVAGQVVDNHHLLRRLSLANSQSQAKQTHTVTVDTAANSTAYTVTINGVDVVYTSDASGTKAEICDGLADAINAEPLVRGQVSAVSDGVDTVTVTSTWPGVAFTLAESDGNLSNSAGTSNASAAAVGFGLACVATTYGDDVDAQAGAVALDDLFTSQVVTVDYTYSAGKVLTVTIVDQHSKEKIAEFAYTLATSKDSSTTAIAAGLNAQLPANSVLAANAGASGYELTLTSEKKGFEFAVAVHSDATATVAESATYTTGPSPATSLLRSFVGVSEYRTDVEVNTVEGTAASYKANEGFVVVQSGKMWVAKDSSETINYGDAVWVEMDDSSSYQGRFYKTASSTRVLLPGAWWERQARSDTSDYIGVICYDLASVRAAASTKATT